MPPASETAQPAAQGPSPGGPPRPLKPMPGVGVRGGMAFAAGGLDKEIRAQEMGYVGWLFGLEGGYRFTRVFAAGLFGEVYGFEPGKGFCATNLSCSMGGGDGRATMGKALSASGTGLDDAMELAASQLEGGYVHTLTLSARLVYGM